MAIAFERRKPDSSQRLRRTVQLVFLALNVWIGVEFYLFVRYYENAGHGAWVERPPGVEGWLPIAALMNLKAWILSGEVPAVHPAGMFLLIAFLAISLLFRKAFCSWLCPVGTVSEMLWRLGRRAFGRNFVLPRWADLPLRSLKYILLALFGYAVGSMSVDGIRAFLEGPYGVIADVKMLNFFRHLGGTAAVVLAALAVLSVLVQNFWCRYLCPYGALLSLPALTSLMGVRRDAESCINCAKCTRACPAQLPVHRLVNIRSAECTGCLECVAVCPVKDTLEMTVAWRRRVPAWLFAAGIAVVFVGVVGFAQWRGWWHSAVPSQVYLELVPRAAQFTHP